MKKITTLLVLFIFTLGFSQNRKGQLQLNSSDYPHELYVVFGLQISFSSSEYTKELQKISSSFKLLSQEYQMELQQGIEIDETVLQLMEVRAMHLVKSASAVKKLRNIFKITVPNPTNELLLEIAQKMEMLDVVEYCSLVSLQPIQPPYDIPPTTPDWEANQGYIYSNPGVSMNYAWDMGLTGQGIKIRDVEYGFNKNHEELMDVNAFLASNMTINSNASVDFTEHGTGVLGIVYGHKGGYGISGLAHGAQEIILYPEWQETGYSRVGAISRAINDSSIGDIIIYEMQAFGFNGTSTNPRYVPAEYEQIVWDLTKAATDSGIIIVAAAGNGSQNLDNSSYSGYRNRGNSGAIIVGAGTADVHHNRVSFSSYGNRVDLQGWGYNVLSSGYGDAFQIGGDFNQYYTNFSGTSSATPIVASCVAVLMSYYHGLTGEYMTNTQIKTILRETGIDQGTGVAGNIGPLPNMEMAVQRVYQEYLMHRPSVASFDFGVLPNPALDKLSLVFKEGVPNKAQITIINTLGQIVYSGGLSADSSIDVSGLETGMYFVKVETPEGMATQRILKK